MGTRDSDSKDDLKLKVESDEGCEKRVSEENFEKRFKSCARRIINLNKVIKVFKENENRRVIMADEFKVTLPVFDGEDYNTWKKRITVFLKMKKCEKVIQRESAETGDEATWNDADLKAMNYIYSALSNRQMELIDEETTSYGIIKKLDKLYLRESTALQICVRNK